MYFWSEILDRNFIPDDLTRSRALILVCSIYSDILGGRTLPPDEKALLDQVLERFGFTLNSEALRAEVRKEAFVYLTDRKREEYPQNVRAVMEGENARLSYTY